MSRLGEFDALAKTILSEKRYRHSVAVQNQSGWLAEALSADVERAMIAGILHDICKEMPCDEQLQYLKAHGILLGDVEKNANAALHGFTASVWIMYELDYRDEGVLDAIRYHTTARPDMTLLEKILFVADLTSADRAYEQSEYFLTLLPEQIDRAVFEMLSYTIGFVLRNREPVLPESINAYNYYLLKNVATP